MKRLLLIAAMLCGLLLPQLLANTKRNTDSNRPQTVHLITEQELEIAYPTLPKNAKEVYKRIQILLDGKEVPFTYLSYFDFGVYAQNPIVNVRLHTPIEVGTYRGKTGVSQTPGSNTQAQLGPQAAARIQVKIGKEITTAQWVPFYDYKNIGSKSKIAVTGTKDCNTIAANDSHLNIAYSNEHVIDYAGGGIHRMTGRGELITQNAVDHGVDIMLVGTHQSVYEAPQWRELYNPADYRTRRVIEGTVEKPIIVATADDVMRQTSQGDMLRTQSDFFYLGEAFIRLFWQVAVDGSEQGATLGCRRVPLSVYNSANDYRYDLHIAQAYAEALREQKYPGNRMLQSVEDYFVYGAMIFYEFIPESADGKWYLNNGPVNTREELKQYDANLYRPLCGIFGEWEYFSSENSQGFDKGGDGVRSAMPWFWHTQPDNFTPQSLSYPNLAIEHVWVIAENQIEVKFNREVKDINNLYESSNWVIEHSEDGGVNWSVIPHKMAGGYLWCAITLELPSSSEFCFTTGNYGRSFRGFTQQDLDERSLEAGGWIASDEKVSATALKFGEYVGLDEAISKHGAGLNGAFRVRYTGVKSVHDWSGNRLEKSTSEANFKPWVGHVYRSPLVGVYMYADSNVSKEMLVLSGMYYDLGFSNNLYQEYTHWPSGKAYTANERTTQAYYDRPGQRIADYATKQGGGMLIVGEGQHANQQPERRIQQVRDYHAGLYVEGWGGNIFQDHVNNIVRDYSMTRYKNEFLLYHEGGHGIDSYTTPESYAPWVFTNITDAHDEARAPHNEYRYYDENHVGAYLSSRIEYVSTGATFWNGTMRESKDGTNDGTWTPISNRWEFYRYDPWGFEAFKRLFWTGDLGLWYENRVGDPAYRVLASDWKYLQHDESLNKYLTLQSGLYGGGETVRIDSENALIAWGCTIFETLYNDPYNGYKNPLVKWVSWSTPMIYDITRTESNNPQYPKNNMGFKGGVLYYPEAEVPVSYENPFLRAGGVKRPMRSAEEEARLAAVSGEASNLQITTPVLPTFTFDNADKIGVDNAQSSFIARVNGERIGFRFFKSEEGKVTLYLNWPLEPTDIIDIEVVQTGQIICSCD